MLPSEFVEAVNLTRDVVRTRPVDPRAALAAVELGVLIYSQAYDDALLPELTAMIGDCEGIAWTAEEAATVALAKLKLQFNVGMTRTERESATQVLKELAERTNASHIPSRRSCSLVSGIGILKGTLGDIAASMEPIEVGLALAQRLDNGRYIVAAHTNLAVKHGWMGAYQQQRELATKALSCQHIGVASVYNTITATFEYALAATMLGDHAAARRAMEEQRYRVPSTATNALQQTWMMLQADICSLLGDDSAAFQLSLDALHLSDGRILAMRTTAGAGARAALRILACAGVEDRSGALLMLSQLRAESARLDATEAAEVVAAFLMVEEGFHERQTGVAELRELLSRLPMTTALRLEALRTPPPPECRRIE
jgi:hypothetical protein